MIKRIPLLFLLIFLDIKAQEFQFSGSVNLRGILSSDSLSPFWFHSNQRGRIDEKTNFSGWVNFATSYNFTESTFVQVGAGGLFQTGFTDKFQPDEYYLTFQKDWFHATVGRKQRKELYRGLSATNENMLWSLNARPMPGLRFSTTRPVMFWRDGWLGFEGGVEEYLMDDVRYIRNARVHHKNVKLVYTGIRDWEFRFGIRHFVQWAGTSTEFGKLPGSLKDYFRIVLGKGIGGKVNDEISDQEINGLGNHLGSYEINLRTVIYNYNLEILYNHIFEDGSGARLRNTPDGRYGIFISDTEGKKWLEAIMYEFYYTKNQSRGSSTTDGIDNYFNNNLYRSGWTYENRILGIPFVTLKDSRFRIGNSIFVAHHLGFRGTAVEKMPYKMLTSYRVNYGAKGSYFPETEKVFSTYLDIKVLQAYMDLNVQLGGDFSSTSGSNLGVGLRFSRNLFR